HNPLPLTVLPAHAGIQARAVSGGRASEAIANRQEPAAVGDRPPDFKKHLCAGGRPIPHGSRLPRDPSEGPSAPEEEQSPWIPACAGMTVGGLPAVAGLHVHVRPV